MMDTVMRLVIVETNDIMQLGLKAFIAEMPGFRMMDSFSTVTALYRFLDTNRADMLLLSDALPGVDTLDTLRYLRAHHSNLHVVIFGADVHVPLIRKYLKAGAAGFIARNDLSRHTLIEGLNAVRRDGFYLPTQVSRRLLDAIEAIRPLSGRRYQVLLGIAEHLTVKQIAERYDTTHKAIYTARDQLRLQLGVSRNEDILPEAIARGLFGTDEAATDHESGHDE